MIHSLQMKTADTAHRGIFLQAWPGQFFTGDEATLVSLNNRSLWYGNETTSAHAYNINFPPFLKKKMTPYTTDGAVNSFLARVNLKLRRCLVAVEFRVVVNISSVLKLLEPF